jgi:hypothetical protein
MPGPSEPVVSARPPIAGSWEESINANSAAADDDGSVVSAVEIGLADASADADGEMDGDADAEVGRGVTTGAAGAVDAAFAGIGWIETYRPSQIIRFGAYFHGVK